MVERIEFQKEDLIKLFDAYVDEMIKDEIIEERRTELKEKWDKAISMTVEDFKEQKVVDMEMYRMAQFIHEKNSKPLPPASEGALEFPEDDQGQIKKAA